MRGLLGRDQLAPGEGVLLRPAPSIHTFFMRFAIDVVFLDWDLRVLRISEHLRPWRVAGCRGARSILELRAGAVEERGLRVGDRLLIREADGSSNVPAPSPTRNEIDVVLASHDRRFLRVVTFLLTRAGISVRTTPDASDVVELLRNCPADAVVIDASHRVPIAIRSLAAINSLYPDVGVVLVAERADMGGLAEFPVLEKWSSFDSLHEELQNVFDREPRLGLAHGAV
jgi:uncharacterized membrane protein (UPF0127 family)